MTRFSGGIRASLIAITVAQALKLPIRRITTGSWNPKYAISSGGMPSSHAAGVASLATYIGFKKGWRSIDFALAAVFGMIVMYDAMGVRRHAGEIAVEVNKLEKIVNRLALEHHQAYRDRREEKLNETIGHLPQEVVSGALLGIVIGSICYWGGHIAKRR